MRTNRFLYVLVFTVGISTLGAEIAAARLLANPGCYPTAALLPLVPLIEAGQIEPDEIIIDAKSGVSGAGRSAKEANLFTEVAEGLHAYGVANHRHAPEIEQGLGEAAGAPVTVTFTPHLVPMNRGILATIYVRLAAGVAAEDLQPAKSDRRAAGRARSPGRPVVSYELRVVHVAGRGRHEQGARN